MQSLPLPGCQAWVHQLLGLDQFPLLLRGADCAIADTDDGRSCCAAGGGRGGGCVAVCADRGRRRGEVC